MAKTEQFEILHGSIKLQDGSFAKVGDVVELESSFVEAHTKMHGECLVTVARGKLLREKKAIEAKLALPDVPAPAVPLVKPTEKGK